MVRIIYGIQSDGLGHYSRSKLVIDFLLKKGHEVKIVTSGKPYELMKDDYNVECIERIHFVYENNRVNYTKTLYSNFVKFPTILKDGLRKTKRIFNEFKPELAIIDVEIFTARVARKKRIPMIAVDNIHSIARTDATKIVKKKFKLFEAEQRSFVEILAPRSSCINHYFITSFFDANPTRKKTSIIPSLIREEIINKKNTKEKEHILVYQTSKTNKDLFPALKEITKEKFIVYGFDIEKKEDNLEFKKTNISNSFLDDLASCKAIITNGGFSLMSEAIFLKKPVMSNPVTGQFEQILNATQLEKEGYGMFVEKITSEKIKLFLKNLDRYKQNLENYKQEDNREALSQIEKKIEEVLNIR